MVQTYQRADLGKFGVSYKIAYMPDETGTPIHTCFQVNGTSETPVNVQGIVPDLAGFQYVKDTNCYEKYALLSGSTTGSIRMNCGG
ncbi:counting factor associated protein D [Caerostris extrusa]|uniref:Counting factor associated protein D n=1 Tax=Caerostris extrusa TaxID=172846 RepID=A0AAV4Y4Z9_CAEEX|nr:counting factor associated protein D [Caerostris extrusa]